METVEDNIGQVKIELLTNHQTLVHDLASWAYEEWHRRNNTDFSSVLYDYQIRAQSAAIPSCWIAFCNEQPVGMVSLKKCDLLFRTDLSPWLSALYVKKEYRGGGIGTLLIKKVIEEAARLKYKKLFLFTDRTNTHSLTQFYTKRNWTFFDKSTDMQGYEINVLMYTLT